MKILGNILCFYSVENSKNTLNLKLFNVLHPYNISIFPLEMQIIAAGIQINAWKLLALREK